MSSAVAELENYLQSMLALKPPGVSGSKIHSITTLCTANVQVRIFVTHCNSHLRLRLLIPSFRMNRFSSKRSTHISRRHQAPISWESYMS